MDFEIDSFANQQSDDNRVREPRFAGLSIISVGYSKLL